MDQRFWRLLGACELLAREETAAITQRDLGALTRTQEVKAAILADLAAQAGVVNAACDSRARARLDQLLEGSRRNAAAVAGMMASARERERELGTALNQLRTLRARYRSGHAVKSRQPFSAHV